ncbi:MAG: TonB-dependent receptor [Chlorobiota bacterium]|nr:MAG: TonB-dependent receptor [Chlorobiota bacterium]
MKVNKMKRILIPVIFLLFALPGFAQKKEAPADTIQMKYQTDDVVITATRVGEKIIDIPYPVYRLDNKSYTFDKKTAINDVLGAVPGLFMQSRYGNHDVRISIRGFGSRSNSGIRGVRILLDGIPESEPDGQTRIEAIDFNSVGAIEIVKGSASSLYTNAPGGVVNFINEIDFPTSFVTQFNEFGAWGLRRNGFKLGLKAEKTRFMLSYNYHNFGGYREHSEDFWNIMNTVLETDLSDVSKLSLYGYTATGIIKLPGSLKQSEFDTDPFQAAKTERDFNYYRLSNKGRFGIKYALNPGGTRANEFEVTGYFTFKYFERSQKTVRIINRYGLGASARYTNRTTIFGLNNLFSLGGDLLYQSGPIEEYNNINGAKGDVLLTLNDETIENAGFYIQERLEFIPDKLALLLTGRYDNVIFSAKNRILGSNDDMRRFEAFTPKAALNFKLTPYLSLYTSFGLGFDSPAGNELDNYPTSSNQGKYYNPDLEAQKSKNFDLGVKGNLIFSSGLFNYLLFEGTFFNITIDNEIVPFEVLGGVYYRNSAKTNRTGFELGAETAILKALVLKLAYTYSNFSYDTYAARVIKLDNNGNFVTEDRDFGGKVVPSVPKHNIYFAAQYQNNITENLAGFLKLSVTHISDMYADDANMANNPSYTILNSVVGLDWKLENLNFLLSGGVNNILDKRYAAFLNINSTSGRYYELGEPRNTFLSFTAGYRF